MSQQTVAKPPSKFINKVKEVNDWMNDNYIETVEIPYRYIEIIPSKLTSNQQVRWLFSDFSRFFKPLSKRIDVMPTKIQYYPNVTLWWEILLTKDKVQFLMALPKLDGMDETCIKQIKKTWKQSNIVESDNLILTVPDENTLVKSIILDKNCTLPLKIGETPLHSPLESILDTKHYIEEGDVAVLQIGMTPIGSSWSVSSMERFNVMKQTTTIPKKQHKRITFKDLATGFGKGVGVVSEELCNIVGEFVIPDWENIGFFNNFDKEEYKTTSNRAVRMKCNSEGFNVSIRIATHSDNDLRRVSMCRSLLSAFDDLEGDNKLVEEPLNAKSQYKVLQKMYTKQHTHRKAQDILCSLELAKIIQVPDAKAQEEHYNELNLINNKSEIEVPKEIFIADKGSISFGKHQGNDGSYKNVYFQGKNPNLLCMTRILMGEPGCGKTTLDKNLAIQAFLTGYGTIAIDVADGMLVDGILASIPPEKLNKVVTLDLNNSMYPVGLGFNEAFYMRNRDNIEDLLVEDLIYYIELVSGTELNMRAKQWVENAIKAVFTSPDATLQDVENMLNNADYRNRVIDTISDPQLKKDWIYYSSIMTNEQRATIYDEAFRRLSPVLRKKSLKKFILQSPKKDNFGRYLVDIRKWMDEGYLVLIKATESMGETIQTALVSFLLCKINMAIISREDTPEDDRKPCFLIMDEPDHYIKGSERWRRMLTRYRKYHCGLILSFHGWEQLTAVDKKLPDIIRKAGPHYLIFQTSEDNLLELKSIIEPEFKIRDLAKGMPKHHMIVKLKMYNDKGEAVPAFMAKSLDPPEKIYLQHKSNLIRFSEDTIKFGRPEHEVLSMIFNSKNGAEEYSLEGRPEHVEEKEVPTIPEMSEEDKAEDLRKCRRKLEYEVGNYIEDQIERGEEPDEDLVTHIDEILEEG